MTLYAAKLLFQFRVNASSGKRRLCEERIIHFKARSAQYALNKAKRRGKEAEYSFSNSDGNKVSFEFVGLMDLMSLGIETEADVVWYEIRDRLMPKERRGKILPTEHDLLTQLSGGTQ